MSTKRPLPTVQADPKEKEERIRRFEDRIFPVLLIFWPLVNITQGVSVMDTTYSLGNYRYLGPDSMWYFATFLANVAGKFLNALPVGRYMITMNLVCSLFISIAALVCYQVFRRYYPALLVFVSEWIAISLYWCPSVILYNTLTNLFLTIGVVLLFLAIRNDKAGVYTIRSKAGKYYVLAGLFLGLNVMVRFSNLTQAGLILALWFWCGLTGKRVQGALRRTLSCILGYAFGFGVPFLVSMIAYGPTAYVEKIGEMFAGTSGASSYSAGSMILSTLSAYKTALSWFLMLVVMLLVVSYFVWFLTPKKSEKPKHWNVYMGLVYALFLASLVLFYYRRGMFTVNFQDYWCMFQWAMMLLIVCILVLVLELFGVMDKEADIRFLAAACLILILILPLGSNNYTFPILDCLFVIAPVSLGLIWKKHTALAEKRREEEAKKNAPQGKRRSGKKKNQSISAMTAGMKNSAEREKEEEKKQKRQARLSFFSMPYFFGLALIVGACVVIGSAFHVQFAFRDGTDGEKRTAQVFVAGAAAGMETTPENEEMLDSLAMYLKAANLTGQETIVFGNAPGLHYLYSLPPALTTTWVDLDSYPTGQFEKELNALTTTPLVILHESDAQSESASEKEQILRAFLTEKGYLSVYNKNGCNVLRVQGEETIESAQ